VGGCVGSGVGPPPFKFQKEKKKRSKIEKKEIQYFLIQVL